MFILTYVSKRDSSFKCIHHTFEAENTTKWCIYNLVKNVVEGLVLVFWNLTKEAYFFPNAKVRCELILVCSPD